MASIKYFVQWLLPFLRPSAVTHTGRMHADEIFAWVVLRSLFLLRLVRSRDQKDIDRGRFRIDVGGIDDPDHGYHDHHRPGGAGTRSNGVPYATFGSVWRIYGTQYCRRIAREYGIPAHVLAKRVDDRLVQGSDAGDVGQLVGSGKALRGHAGLIPEVPLLPDVLELFNRIHFRKLPTPAGQRFQFLLAARVARFILDETVRLCADDLAAERLIESLGSTKAVLVIPPGHYLFWTRFIRTRYPLVKCVVFQNSDDLWQADAIPTDAEVRSYRMLFPEEWRGLRDADLVRVTTVSDAIYCSNNGNLCVTRSKEGVLQLVSEALSRQQAVRQTGVV